MASGSKGNAAFVGSAGGGVLVDAGLPCRHLEERMGAAGLDPRAVLAVVVTHEHRDHLAGVGVWARRHQVPVYLTDSCRGAAAAVLGPRGLDRVEVRTFATGSAFRVGELELLPFSTSHDAADSVGFRITCGSSSLGFATDLGRATHSVRDHLSGVDALFLESNHDESRLLSGPYPWFLKQRIRSRHGHLSNDACASLVSELLHDRLRTLVLGHLSETNNEPHLAFHAAREVLCRAGAQEEVTLLVARQHRPGRVVTIRN